ncbi:unnamed protein product [Danaus chrysippus]|uniref:(African queen) hypothetical protein n=1 Tax=Danaus chrysippus TaxID=151541 RepID=A0A8J2R1S2_9NEOP|nr:unnamed protein product [Danaus chrysippus]
MAEILNEINKLCLESLSTDWVDSVYNSEFLEFGDLPEEYESLLESLDIKTIFQDTMNACDSWLDPNFNDGEERSWSVISHQIKHQSLLSLLAYFIDNGSKNVLTKEHRNNAILAARVYYKLLLIPGYKVYHIYHSQLFAHSLVCLSFPKTMCDNEDNYFNARELSCEVNYLIKKLGKFVTDLKTIIETLQLKPSDMNFEDIMSNLVDITGGAIVNKLNIDKIELANVSRTIYEMIDILICGSNQTPNPLSIQVLFKCLLPKLISASVDSRNVHNVVRASYVTYSGLLLTKYGKAALNGYTILLQHLCYTLDGLERAEVRTARVSLVVGLMSLLPTKSYKKIVTWLLKLSSTSKISHRQVALEILSKLLSNDPEPSKDNPESNSGNTGNTNESTASENEMPEQANDTEIIGENAEEQLPTNDDDEITDEEVSNLLMQRAHVISHSEVLRAVYERVHDTSSTIRTRALAILTDCLQSEVPAIKEAMQELSGEGEVSRLAALGARCVCDERAVVRKAAVGLIHRLIANTSDGQTPNKEYAAGGRSWGSPHSVDFLVVTPGQRRA